MTQVQNVRNEYLRWIAIYLWFCGIPACDQEPEYRLLNYTSFVRLRESLLTKLKLVPEERFMVLRDQARVWLFSIPLEKQKHFFEEYDALEMQSALNRIDWSQQLRRQQN